MKQQRGEIRRVLILVGTDWRRNFLISSALRVASAAGLDVLLVDSAKRRLNSIDRISNTRFLPTEIDDCGRADLTRIADTVAAFAKASGFHVEAVFTGLDAYIELAAVLADRFIARGNSEVAAGNAQTKSRMRHALAADVQLTTAFGLAGSASEARSRFKEIGGPAVVKPVRGAGSRGVRTGIRSMKEAAMAWESVRQELQKAPPDPGGADGLADVPIMIERQLIGSEVDVELVLQSGRCAFAAVADNPAVSLPVGIETGTTYPSQLPESDHNALVDGALRALERLGLRDGNFHIEMVLTAEGPKIIEVNARMGGAFVWEAIRTVYGVDLVELGLSAVLGRTLPQQQAAPRCALEAWFFITSVSGVFLRAEGLEVLEQCPGYAAMGLWKAEGDRVLAPAEAASDYLGFAAFCGATADEARERAAEAFRQASFWIRTETGEVVQCAASFMHESD